MDRARRRSSLLPALLSADMMVAAMAAAAQSPDLTTAAQAPARSPSLATPIVDDEQTQAAVIALILDPQLIFLFSIIAFLCVILCTRNAFIVCRWRVQRRRLPAAAGAVASDLESPSTSNSAYRHGHGHGLSEATIKALPASRFSEAVTAAGGNLECAVCLTEFEDGDELRTMPLCGHAFHAECIGRWLRTQPTCPLCRSAVLCLAPLLSGRIRQFPVDILFIDAAWPLPHRPPQSHGSS